MWAQGIVNYDNIDIKTLKVPLNRKHQLMLMRYIEAETVEKDFIAKGLGSKFTQEIFLHFYFACHGCSDHTQKVLLNEREVSKIFW